MIGKSLLFAALLLAVDARGPVARGSADLTPLSSEEVQVVLAGKAIAYSPPGWADSGVSEQFHGDSRWTGTHYSRGPDRFAGQWKVQNGQLCVRAKSGSTVARYIEAWFCRTVWRQQGSGRLFIDHLLFN